ncbi:MAG: hypothetical protein JST36_08440 [Bacteroidetes bacterium]|nr:hypothetical protein [Bacteroidota bacterium]
MKRSIFFIGMLLLVSSSVFAQKRAPEQLVGCMDPAIRAQADTIKQHYLKQGFIVFRDAMINMESMSPFPVVVQLAKGHLYQIIFVGPKAATNHKMVVYDGNDNKLKEAANFRKHDQASTNYIVYEFLPDHTDNYLFTFMSRWKNKEFCGSVCILATDKGKEKIQYTPYVPGNP